MQAKVQNAVVILFAALLLEGCMSPSQWWSNINARARDLQQIRVKYSVLEKEYEELRMQHLELEHKFQSMQAELEMERAQQQNREITGNPEGRHLANIKYTVPEKLTMQERYDLAFEHVEHKKFQDAFVVFESFLWVPEGAPFQTTNAYYSAGVAAYKIKNFSRAREYFEAANTHGDGLKDAEILRRTSLWLKILAKNDRSTASEE